MDKNCKIIFIYALIFYLIAFRAVSDLAVDNAFVVDTFFIAQLGWRELNGLNAVLDYTHFYGGLTAKTVAVTFKMFGATLKALDYAYLILFAFVSGISLFLGYRRVSAQSTALIILLSASILIGPLSIEDGYWPIVNHSFVYNHFGMTILLATTIFVLNPQSGNKPLDYVCSFVCGTLLTVLALTKPTFVFTIPFFIMVLMIQEQRQSWTVVLLGMFISALVFDPGLKLFLGSLDAILSSGAAERSGGVLGRSAHGYMTLVAHAGFFLALLYFWGLLIRLQILDARRSILCQALCIAVFFVATLTMNGRPHLMILPIFIPILLFNASKLNHDKSQSAFFIANSFAAIIIIPSLLFATSTWLAAKHGRLHQLVTYGPLVDYVFIDPTFKSFYSEFNDLEMRRAFATRETLYRLTNSGPERRGDAYVELADGISLLATIKDIESNRIITANGMVDFSFAVRSKPEPSFPVWPNKSRMNDLDLSQVDIIMARRLAGMNLFLTKALLAQIHEEFTLCKQSDFFDLLVRRDQFATICKSI